MASPTVETPGWGPREPFAVRQAERLGRLVLGGVFVFAAGGKALHPWPFVSVVDTLLATTVDLPGRVESSLVLPVLLAVVAWEGFLGFALIVGVGLRGVALAAAFTLAVFCVVLVRLLLLPGAPACGCFGAFPAWVEDAREGVRLGLVRNAGLIWLAVWIGVHRRVGVKSRRPGRSLAGARGFSLVETVIVVALIGLLVSVSLPALGRARERARFVGSLSDLRQLLAAVDMYTESQRFFPYLGVPGEPERGLVSCVGAGGTPPSYFGGHRSLWPTALARDGQLSSALLAADASLTASRVESLDESGVVATYVQYTHAAVADPRYWRAGEIPCEPGYFRSLRPFHVRFPSGKGLLADAREDVFRDTTAEDGWSVGAFDGSAQFRLREPVVHDGLHRPYGALPWSVLTTPGGLHGRDW